MGIPLFLLSKHDSRIIVGNSFAPLVVSNFALKG